MVKFLQFLISFAAFLAEALGGGEGVGGVGGVGVSATKDYRRGAQYIGRTKS